MRLCFNWFCRSIFTIAAITILGSRAEADPLYTVTDLTLPGDTWSYPGAINNAGQAVGFSGSFGFLYSNGTLSRLDTTPRAINDLGQMPQGSVNTINNATTGINDSGDSVLMYGVLVKSDGSQTNLGTLGGSYTDAYGINNSDQIVGDSWTKDGAVHAFVYSGGKMTDLGLLPGATNAVAYGINDAGQIVGGGWNGGSNAFLYQDGKLTNLGSLGNSSTTKAIALAINASGQIVGWSDFGNSYTHAFLYSNGKMYDLNDLISKDLGWTIVSANGINSSGQILADAVKGGSGHAVLLTPLPSPVPEPSTLAIFGILITSVSFRARWRRTR